MQALVVLIDHIIQLVQLKKARRRELFQEIVEPLFKDLEPIVQDYFEMLQLARSRRLDTASSRRRLCKTLATRAVEQVAVRRKVQEMVRVVRETVKDDAIVQFAASVEALFYPDINQHEHSSVYMYLISALGRAAVQSAFDDDPEPSVEVVRMMVDLEEDWQRVVEIYGKLRISHLANQ